MNKAIDNRENVTIVYMDPKERVVNNILNVHDHMAHNIKDMDIKAYIKFTKFVLKIIEKIDDSNSYIITKNYSQ